MKLYLRPSRELAARRLEQGGPRVYDPRERWALSGFDLLLRALTPVFRLGPPRHRPDPSSARRILALRLDRMGDLVMTLPALAWLRELAPSAEIELAVGSWNEKLARGLPFVDRVRVVDVPSADWSSQARWLPAMRALSAGPPPNLTIDFQGDVRVIFLMAWGRPRARAGFDATGGGHLLTHKGRWDESLSWYRQNVELVGAVFPRAELPERIAPYNFVLPADRERANAWLNATGLAAAPRPRIGIHPSAGRAIKQWEPDRFATLADRLSDTTHGTVALTGGPKDRDLVESVRSLSRSDPRLLIADVGVRTFAAALERFDLFVTGDTGPMHLANAVGTPNVALFGPSDPVRYGPEPGTAPRAIVRQKLYCSPCNMIRKPPRECTLPASPECLSRITVERVLEAASKALREREA